MSRFINHWLTPYTYTTIVPPYIPELSYWVNHSQGVNDLHIHLNGSTETDRIWFYMIKYKDEVVQNYAKSYSSNFKVRKLSAQIYPGFNPEILSEMMEHAKSLREKICLYIGKLEYGKDKLECTTVNELYGDINGNMRCGVLIEEILLCIISLCEIREHDNPYLACLFHHYLLIKNVVHQFAVMQYTQIGFSQFQLLTDNTFRDKPEQWYKDRFLQLLGTVEQGNMGTIEGRFSPQKTSIEICNLVHKIKTGFDDATKVLKSKSDCKNINLSLGAHFVKKTKTEESKKLPVRHNLLRKDLRGKCFALLAALKTNEVYSLVRGIDAAANEMDAGPEVFAETYRLIRKAGIKHFTYHAGEDFRHLISGLRAIVESIDFLGLYPEDRLGHCTALGIDPYLWRNGIHNTCIISQGEWLDDLVFAWHLLGQKEPASETLMLRTLESKIMELSLKVYGEAYHPLQLLKAWNLRKYAPFVYICDDNAKLATYDQDEMREFRDVQKLLEDFKLKEILHKYHAPSEKDVYSKYRNEYDKLINIDCDYIFTMETLSKLQMHVLDYVAQKAIVIETLPSSNLRISYYRKMEEYHLIKWLDGQESNMNIPNIVLGSDDLGIFLTNIFNEYARVFCYLGEKGLSPAKRIEKIKLLHESSQMYKFI